MKKQLTMSLISDELGQASTKKKEFLGIMEKLIPWSEWVGIVRTPLSKITSTGEIEQRFRLN